MVWGLEPDDPIEPDDEWIHVCNVCHKYTEYCECEGDTETTGQWALKCRDCGQIFLDDDEWSNHNDCDGPSYDWYD